MFFIAHFKLIPCKEQPEEIWKKWYLNFILKGNALQEWKPFSLKMWSRVNWVNSVCGTVDYWKQVFGFETQPCPDMKIHIYTYIHTLLLPPQWGFSGTIT